MENDAEMDQTEKALYIARKQAEVNGVLKSLPSRDQEIVRSYYGFSPAFDGVCPSEKELLDYYGISKDYLEAVKQKVKRRLNHKPDAFLKAAAQGAG